MIVVDASGSMARTTVRRAKGIALATLNRAYQDRAQVAIVLARGRTASVGLPPTRATARARNSLRALPTGGGTPLASALVLAARLAARHPPAQVETLILTDGRANVALTPGGDPHADAARAMAELGRRCRSVVVENLAPRHRATDAAWLWQGV